MQQFVPASQGHWIPQGLPSLQVFYVLFLALLRREGRNLGETKQQCSSLCQKLVMGVKSTTGCNSGAGFMSGAIGCPAEVGAWVQVGAHLIHSSTFLTLVVLRLPKYICMYC